MKYLLLSLFFLLALVLRSESVCAHHAMPELNQILKPAEQISISDSEEMPRFKIRLCLNTMFVSICAELDCDLHWTDAIIPGFGQILGHDGCVPTGTLTSPGGGSSSFAGSEGMIQGIEAAKGVPTGTLKYLEVLDSPTFPAPDGKNYRVVAKTYPILNGDEGRYLPFNLEVVK